MKRLLKILIIDSSKKDNEIIIEELHRQKLNFQTKNIIKKNEFIDVVSEYKPDIILSDYYIPHSNGISLLKLSKKITPKTPFIIITGKINTGSMKRLSDMFTGSQSPFVVIYDATTDNDPRNRTFILNKAGIAWVEPKDSFEVEDRQT